MQKHQHLYLKNKNIFLKNRSLIKLPLFSGILNNNSLTISKEFMENEIWQAHQDDKKETVIAVNYFYKKYPGFFFKSIK